MGGIHGKILSVDDDTVTIEIDKGAKMKVEKASISMENTKRINS
jgi:preprotein translocase subunit YajC